MGDFGGVGVNSAGSDTIKYTESECMDVYNKVKNLSYEVRNTRAEIGSSAGSMGYWIGQASENFRRECGQLVSELDALAGSLDSNAQGLINAVRILNESEQHVEIQISSELSTDNIFNN